MTRVICFYLPQFHVIPENNAWWGEGFTEWLNVKRAKPLFDGHYQPHAPLNDYYYSLDDIRVQKRHVSLAKKFGIFGFCFYFYWFNGKTLLEAPTKRWLQSPELDLPFCLCWANENWTRRWDGGDDEILVPQVHSFLDDRNFINHIIPYLKDSRYIRIEGKPLIVLYRPNLLPNAQLTASAWRSVCESSGVGPIHLSYVQGFDRSDPGIYGFDSAIEFPPLSIDNAGFRSERINNQVRSYSSANDYNFNLYDYKKFVQFSENYPELPYTLFRGVCPSWDNTARRLNSNAFIVHNATPESYHEWLLNACLFSKSRSQQQSSNGSDIVFINAWNEWGEGCHLEPDTKFHYRWLQETRRALDIASHMNISSNHRSF